MNHDQALLDAVVAQRDEAMNKLAACSAALAVATAEIQRIQALLPSGDDQQLNPARGQP